MASDIYAGLVMGKSAASLVEEHLRLVDHIIIKRFAWVTTGGPTRRVWYVPHRYEFEDLHQEGVLGLLMAAARYSTSHAGRAKFITYAYCAIYWHLLRFVSTNMTILSLRGYKRDHVAAPESARERMVRAVSCVLFSELSGESQDLMGAVEAPSDKLDLTDLEEYCLEKVHDSIEAMKIETLYKYFAGDTYDSIAQYLECSREGARGRVAKYLGELEDFILDDVLKVDKHGSMDPAHRRRAKAKS